MLQKILVTGAGRGLGYSIVKEHLEKGDIVYAYDYVVTDELLDLERTNTNLKVYQCDIGTTESVKTAMKDAVMDGKQIHILYNVAGVFDFDDRVGLVETDLDQCAYMYNVNAVGALRVCQSVFPLLRKGSIVVNISSEAGSIGNCKREKEYAYCMSKAALNMGAKVLSNELSTTQVRVLNIHPGWLKTVMGGEDAAKSPYAITPEKSANSIVNLALNIEEIPKEQMYLGYDGEVFPW